MENSENKIPKPNKIPNIQFSWPSGMNPKT